MRSKLISTPNYSVAMQKEEITCWEIERKIGHREVSREKLRNDTLYIYMTLDIFILQISRNNYMASNEVALFSR